jgi:hypothetical protein
LVSIASRSDAQSSLGSEGVVATSYQTIALSAGRHRSPDDGACAMELASMLAGEPFSDRPASVCPVVAGFLRSYNDHVDDRRRQDLYRYAARVVGTRADRHAERRRGDMCLRFAREICGTPPLRVRILHRLLRCQGLDVHAVYAARSAIATERPEIHGRVLRFLDELIAVTAERPEPALPQPWRSGARPVGSAV